MPMTPSQKIAAIDDLLSEIGVELKAKHASTALLTLIRDKVFPLAFQITTLEAKLACFSDENNRLRLELQRASNPVKDLQIEHLKEKVEKLEETNRELNVTNQNIQKLVRELTDKVTKQAQTQAQTLTYAAALTIDPKTKEAQRIEQAKIRQATTLFIKSTENQDAKAVRQTITRSINPRKDNLHIKSIRTTQTAVIVETATQEDCRKILEKTKDLHTISCEGPRKRRPLVAVYHVPDTLTDEQFLESLYEQNLRDDTTKEDFDREVKIRFRTGPKGRGYNHQVLEVTPSLYRVLTQRQRVYIDFQSLSVKDYTVVNQCFKCCDLGHTTKACTKSTVTCAKCGSQGHKRAECTSTEACICIPCKYRRRVCNKTKGGDCQTYKQLHSRLLDSIDYGN